MKAQKILRDNQYPTGFIEKITSHTLDNILAPVKSGLPAKPNRPKADLNIGLKLMYNGPSSITFAKIKVLSVVLLAVEPMLDKPSDI